MPAAELLASPTKSVSPEKQAPENIKENSEGLIDVQVSKMLDDPVDSSARGSKAELPGIPEEGAEEANLDPVAEENDEATKNPEE